MKTTKKLLILVIAVIFCTSCGMFGLSDSAWSEVFEKQNSMPQNSLDEKRKILKWCTRQLMESCILEKGENLAFMRKIQQKRKSIEKSVLFIW